MMLRPRENTLLVFQPCCSRTGLYHSTPNTKAEKRGIPGFPAFSFSHIGLPKEIQSLKEPLIPLDEAILSCEPGPLSRQKSAFMEDKERFKKSKKDHTNRGRTAGYPSAPSQIPRIPWT